MRSKTLGLLLMLVSGWGLAAGGGFVSVNPVDLQKQEEAQRFAREAEKALGYVRPVSEAVRWLDVQPGFTEGRTVNPRMTMYVAVDPAAKVATQQAVAATRKFVADGGSVRWLAVAGGGGVTERERSLQKIARSMMMRDPKHLLATDAGGVSPLTAKERSDLLGLESYLYQIAKDVWGDSSPRLPMLFFVGAGDVPSVTPAAKQRDFDIAAKMISSRLLQTKQVKPIAGNVEEVRAALIKEAQKSSGRGSEKK